MSSVNIIQIDHASVEKYRGQFTELQNNLLKSVMVDEMSLPEILEHFNIDYPVFEKEMTQVQNIIHNVH